MDRPTIFEDKGESRRGGGKKKKGKEMTKERRGENEPPWFRG